MTHADPILDPALDPLFWDNLREGVPSAWHGHVPFAHWLVSALRPRVLVELGTHAGISYSAFCQAVQRCGLDTRCTAIDAWGGNAHAGIYPEAIYTELKAFHDPRFGGFSRLLRMNFDDATGQFADGSIDLLHIDGNHSYNAVRHDFERWAPKLSDRAVVLFHDTNVGEPGFGVARFWAEICRDHPDHLEFDHGFGLGVAIIGRNPPPAIQALCRAPAGPLRRRFAMLGERQILASDRVHLIAAAPAEPPVEAPMIDPSIECGAIHIAERFIGPPGLNTLRLPRDALTRGEGGCAVWVVSQSGQAWRQGSLPAAPKDDVATLVFEQFLTFAPEFFHLFVTARSPGACGSGLPPALASLLARRSQPITLATPYSSLPKLPPLGLFLREDGQLVMPS